MVAERDNIIGALKQCYDPEIPVNIWDLGLVYGIDIADGGAVQIRMTLTSIGCPATAFILDQVTMKVKKVEGVSDCKVEIVWEPPWSPERMPPEGKKALEMMYGGFIG